MSDPTLDGLLALRFVRAADGTTRLAERSQRFPLRFTVPMYLDAGDPGMAFVYAQNPTGGLFAGDRLALRLDAEQGARVHLTTQSATKVNRMDAGEARQDVDIAVADGAFVEYAPDLLIPQAGSRMTQRVCVRLGQGSAFIGTEMIAPGRFARGEAFAYERLALTFEASDTRGELCSETLVFEPAKRSPCRRGVLGAHPYLATLVAIAPEVDAERLAARLEAAAAAAPDVVAAAGALPRGAGAFARILAPSSMTLRGALERVWTAARHELLGRSLPTRRK